MADLTVAQISEPLVQNLQKLAVSSAKLSTAMALYGLDRAKSAAAIRSSKDFHDFVSEMNDTVSTCSLTLEHEIGERRKEMVEAVTKAGEEAFHFTMQSLRYTDPSRIAEFLTGMGKGSSEAPVEHEPVLAAEALAS